MKYTEEQLNNFAKPLSETEDERAENSIKMIKDALLSSECMNKYDYEVFLQGSYAANTNTRQNSDVDVCVMLKSTVHFKPVWGLSGSDYGYTPGIFTHEQFRSDINRALVTKFGGVNVDNTGNKSIKIEENTYHLMADVVPAFQYRDHYSVCSKESNRFVEGVCLKTLDGAYVYNYPKVNLEKGRIKNNLTNYAYKKFVRIIKRIHYNMVNDGVINEDMISSYVLESLLYNFDNKFFVDNSNWDSKVKWFLESLWCLNDSDAYKLREINGILDLFRDGQKCKVENVRKFAVVAYHYLEYV